MSTESPKQSSIDSNHKWRNSSIGKELEEINQVLSNSQRARANLLEKINSERKKNLTNSNDEWKVLWKPQDEIELSPHQAVHSVQTHESKPR